MPHDLLSPVATPDPWLHAIDPRPARGAGWLRGLARRGLVAADRLWAALTPRAVRDAPGLLILGLHSLCRSRAQLDDPVFAPNQNVCVHDLRALVEAAREGGFTFVAPEQVDAGLDPAGRYAMLTFDDGYHNNVLALEVMREFDVPATFFISSGHVLESKAFWWDAASRELLRAGASPGQRDTLLRRLKGLAPADAEGALQRWFGPGALRPHGDADRPFRPSELADFARRPGVHLGNHTVDHAILTDCSPQEMQRQIAQCQAVLAGIAGRTPVAIAYPNGDHSPAVIEAARQAGLRVGVTVQPGRNPVPVPGEPALMQLSRFYFHARGEAAREFASCRCGFVPSRRLRRLLPA